MPLDQGITGLLENPMFNLGVGILAANKPGATFGQALGGGMMNLQQMQQLKEKAALTKLQTELFQQQVADAKRKAAAQAQMQQRAATYAETADPSVAPLMDMAALSENPMTNILGVMNATKATKPNAVPSEIQQYMLAVQQGYKGSIFDWKQALRKAGAVNVKVDNQFNPLEKRVTADLQSEYIASERVIPMIDHLIKDTTLLPEGVGGIADARNWIGGMIGQAADNNVPGARSVSDTVTPEITVEDPSLPGGQRTINTQSIVSQMESLTIALKPLMADSGPLSNQDRLRLGTSLGDVMAADSKRRLSALRTIREILTRKSEDVERYLRASGGAVPGQPNLPHVTTQQEFDALPPGTKFIAPDGTLRKKK